MIDLTLTSKLIVFGWVEIDTFRLGYKQVLTTRAAAERKYTLNV